MGQCSIGCARRARNEILREKVYNNNITITTVWPDTHLLEQKATCPNTHSFRRSKEVPIEAQRKGLNGGEEHCKRALRFSWQDYIRVITGDSLEANMMTPIKRDAADS